MNNERVYREVLIRMRLVERLGELLYESLAAKELDETLRELYARLAANERATGHYVEKIITFHVPGLTRACHQAVVRAAALLFRLLPGRVLAAGLKNILHRRMYTRWPALYNICHPELWRVLVEHEQLQHDLLSPYWHKSK